MTNNLIIHRAKFKINPAFILLVLLLNFFSVQGQIDVKAENDKATQIKEFKNALNSRFSQIITGNSFSNFGNYAAITTTADAIKGSVSFMRKNGHLINLEISGGAVEGVSAFFTGGELNSNVSMKLNYHLIISPFSENTISRDAFKRQELEEARQKIEKEHEDALLKLKFKKDSLDLIAKNNSIKVTLGKIETQFEALHKMVRKDANLKFDKDFIDGLCANTSVDKYDFNKGDDVFKYKRDSLCYEYAKAKLDMARLTESMAGFDFDEQQFLIDQKRDNAIDENKKKIRELPTESVNLTWVSFGLGISNETFKLFDPTADFESQINKDDYTIRRFNLAISNYQWNVDSPNHFYASLGVNFNHTHNLSDLTSTEIEDREVVSSDPIRETIKTQKVFIGDYKNNLSELIAFLDIYQFFGTGLGNKSNIAVHFNPVMTFAENAKPITRLHTGILIPFKKASDTSSIVNLEVFYRFNDLFTNSASDKSLFSRNTLGLQATFPINFINSK